uniref:HAD family hydrolase n=1 Tax=Candidatus Nanopelagicus sp. TaxID=2518620 RepID=UPI004049809E
MSAILFDMDGTIIDSEPLWLQAEIEVMAELGCHWDEQDQINCLGGPMERTEKYMQDRSGNVKPYGYFGQRLNEVMKLKFVKDLELMPNALELITKSKEAGLKTALVTASGRELMNSALTRFPENSFDNAISRDDVTNSKPHPEPYLMAAKRLEVKIEECLVLEDSMTGVRAGLDSGAQVVAISHIISIANEKNLRVISSLSEITFKQLVEWYPFLDRAVRHDR